MNCESQHQMAVSESASCSRQFITNEEIPYSHWAVGGYNNNCSSNTQSNHLTSKSQRSF